MDKPQYLFLLPAIVKPDLEKSMKEKCWGSCGKVSMGGIIDTQEFGPCWVCCEQVCPHVQIETEVIGKSHWTGEELKIRIINHGENNGKS